MAHVAGLLETIAAEAEVVVGADGPRGEETIGQMLDATTSAIGLTFEMNAAASETTRGIENGLRVTENTASAAEEHPPQGVDLP